MTKQEYKDMYDVVGAAMVYCSILEKKASIQNATSISHSSMIS